MSQNWKGNQTVPPEYLRIATAYSYVELIFDANEGEKENPWRLVTAGGRNPATVVKLIMKVAKIEFDTGDNSPQDRAVLLTAIAQMGDPLFLTYIAGKMGAC